MNAWIGALVGLIVGLIIAFALLKVANTNHKMMTEYDERQRAVRGKGYMYGFYTLIFTEVAMMFLEMSEIELPIEKYTLHFVSIILGCIVLCVYCIWNDVYWGLNNNKKKYNIIFVLAIVFNIIPVVGQAYSGTLMQDGKIGLCLLNIMVLAMMAIVAIEFLIKKIVKKDTAEEEE